MKISVTPDHILRGKRGSSMYCPVALAIREQAGYDYQTHIAVNPLRIWIEDRAFHTPLEVGEFIRSYDNGNAFSNFQFDFELPETEINYETIR